MKLSDFSDVEYEYLKEHIDGRNNILKDLECMLGVSVNITEIPGLSFSIQELDELKLNNNDLPLEVENRFREIIETRKEDIINAQERSKESFECIGDSENEYSSTCCRCCRGYSCRCEPNEMGV